MTMQSFEDAIPVYRPDDNEHMGYIAEDDNGWVVLTMFGIPFGTAPDESAARRLVLEKGLMVLTEQWEYYDPAAKDWSYGVITEATPNEVRIADLYGPNADTANSHLIKNPSIRTLRYPRFK